MDLGLRDRACIVTGASGGIGLTTAKALAAEGASVLLVARDHERLEQARRECAGSGGRASVLVLDVTAPEAGATTVEACLREFGRLDALVNNAGTSASRTLEELTDHEWQAQWELHVMGPMRLMRAAVPVMSAGGYGRIVNISSSSGKRPGQRNVAYSVTKAAELSLSRAFADRYAPDGILVNSITPGPVSSQLWMGPGGLADQVAQAEGITRDEVLRATAKGVPLGRFGTEEEIAAVIVFLCSERASFVTGAAWSVDGGIVPVII